MEINVYAYHIPHGDLYIYGDNIKQCTPYMDDIVDSVEDICSYCEKHNLRIWHKPKISINGFGEMLLVRRLSKKYSVYSTWKELKWYLDSTQVE